MKWLSLSGGILLLLLSVVGLLYHSGSAQSTAPTFVNWESPHVHPLDITPDALRLLAVNTADNRLEVFDVSDRVPVNLGAIPVGLEPVSVRARTSTEAWVVNRVSDTVSVVDLTTFNVVATLKTEDEPADVIFAGNPQRAFVSTSTTDKVMVFDPTNLAAPPTVLDIKGEHPRAMAVSPDGTKVYVAIFESGNRSTNVGRPGGRGGPRPNALLDPRGPYGGVNPPPNSGDTFSPPLNPNNPGGFHSSLIVKKNADSRWMDDNNGDWTDFLSGAFAEEFEHVAGWDVLEHDVAIIDANTLAIGYAGDLLNLNMAIGVNPASGQVTVVGTDGTNEIRFVQNLKARFVRVKFASVDPATATATAVTDLNPHLDYSDAQVSQQSNPATASQTLRDLSVGDPRAIVWNRHGTLGYVAGMGSNNVIVIDSTGARVGDPIPVGEGPTGLVLHPGRTRLYVLNRFEATISVVNTALRLERGRFPFSFDPTPEAITLGRKFQYDTHLTSGLGQVACASCHVDARSDRLAWDLGNPTAEMNPFDENCVPDTNLLGACADSWHPMKGPMVTQTLQDIIGKEPHHWRGDKNGIEEFNVAFTDLQGRDTEPTVEEMAQYKAFLATIFFPPNPYRNFDDSLPTDVPLPGHFSGGKFAAQGGLPRGAPLPNGNAVTGFQDFLTLGAHSARNLDGRNCASCHTLHTGLGADATFTGRFPNSGFWTPFPLGPNLEHHHSITQFQFGIPVKIVQLRNVYQKVGFHRTNRVSRAGFGFFNDGTTSLSEFIDLFEGPTFLTGDQATSDIIALLLAFGGYDPPAPTGAAIGFDPPATLGQNTHPAVGAQVTLIGTNVSDPAVVSRIQEMLALADSQKVDVVVKGRRRGVQRGWVYIGGGFFQSDHAGATISAKDLRLGSGPGAEITFTVVPKGTGNRIGIDRDEDGILDGDDTVLTSSTSSMPRTLFASRSQTTPVRKSGKRGH